MVVLGLIPARGGSRGIPRKNQADLAGRPLLWYTARAARGARRLADAILSTDDPGLARLGRKLGLHVPFVRPRSLGRDTTPMMPVVRHALREWERATGRRVDAVAILQPTSPFRTARHIDAAVALLQRTKADAVVSVQEVPHAFSAGSQMRLRSGWLAPLLPGPSVLRRQSKPRAYARNGPAVLVVRRRQIKKGTFYGGRTRAYPMAAEDSIDIDSPRDLALARLEMTRRSRR